MDKSSYKENIRSDSEESFCRNPVIGNAVVEVTIIIPQEERDILYKSLSIEAREIPSKRTRVDISTVDEGLKIIIYAEDIVPLRAALNSFLRFIDSSLRSIRAIYEL